MNIERFDNDDVLAATLATRLLEAISIKPRIVLGLPTGRTPVALYREIRSRSHRGHVDWSQVRTFNLDEFVGLGAGDAGSYRFYMQAELFNHVRIEPLNVGMLDGRAANLAVVRVAFATDPVAGVGDASSRGAWRERAARWVGGDCFSSLMQWPWGQRWTTRGEHERLQ